MTFGLPRAVLPDIFAAWPSAGFHKRLVQLSLSRLLTHPLTPMPMMRLWLDNSYRFWRPVPAGAPFARQIRVRLKSVTRD